MGRERVLRTYGHHKQRCVLTDAGDIFRSADESRHIFSTSSSESGLGPSDSLDSVEASLGGRRTAKNKALVKLKGKEDEEETKNKGNKRKRQPSERKSIRLFSSDKDSSDGGTPAQKRVPRRALRDKSNEPMGRHQPGKGKQPKRQAARKDQNKTDSLQKEKLKLINFSEFDDYSLIISDSPLRDGKHKGKSVDSVRQLGTSTPCDSTCKRTTPSPDIHTADISFIPAIFENSDVIDDQEKCFSDCYSTFGRGDHVSLSSSPCRDYAEHENHKKDSDDSWEQKNLERLENSFVSLRVGDRQLRKRNELVKTRTPPSDRSDGASLTDSQLEDPIAAECITRIKKLHMNLRPKMVSANSHGEANHVSVFDGSCSLFESPMTAEPNLPSPEPAPTAADNESNDAEHEWSDITGGETKGSDLSAIVEDEEDHGDEDEEDVKVAVVSSTSSEEEDGDEEEDDEECEDDDEESEEEDKRSSGVRPDLSHSFAEVLTPCKAKKKSGEELSPLEKVLEQCGQQEPVPFTTAIPTRILRKCVKIGEGVYGEVFRAMHNGESVALKIIPIEGDFTVNDEPQKTFREILPEIVISNELSRLKEGEENNTPNFCPVRSVSLVQGRYPKELLKQWDIFNKRKNSENDRPDMFGEEQLYIMLEFVDGGCDLDSCKLSSAVQAVSVLKQVACALAVAEQELWFEHRDLHVGNVLVQFREEEGEGGQVRATLSGQPLSIETHGMHVSIIDFTLSRLTKDGCTVFCELATDDTLFEGEGDYQFEIYRMMKAENKNNWEAYHPYTNVTWLHYLCSKLLGHRHFKEMGRPHREALKQLRQAHSCLLDYASACHYVLENPLFLT